MLPRAVCYHQPAQVGERLHLQQARRVDVDPAHHPSAGQLGHKDRAEVVRFQVSQPALDLVGCGRVAQLGGELGKGGGIFAARPAQSDQVRLDILFHFTLAPLTSAACQLLKGLSLAKSIEKQLRIVLHLRRVSQEQVPGGCRK